tara:strand:+ start:214 stop:3801 length:3588 start_codon:yes stop_codon:yes gene_type:complete
MSGAERANVAACRSSGVDVSATDVRDYRFFSLANGVECLLISDPEADLCGAAMDVNVGSFSDPDCALGLAHFLEHLLFLGSSKYPLPNEYERFLTTHGGESNAFTDDECTNYHFEVLPEALDEALDRFAQFFIAPTFEPSMTARELMSVDSEMQGNLQDDAWRLQRLIQSKADAKHPWSRCCDGSLRTLRDEPNASGVDVLAELRTFYDAFYTGGAMKLVVSGTQPLDEIEGWVRRSFVKIRPTPVPASGGDGSSSRRQLPSSASLALPLWPSLPLRLYAAPVKSSRFVDLMFPLPPLGTHWREQPDDFLADLVGHESPGSVLHALKEAGLALWLTAGAEWEHESFSVLKVSIGLSPLGLQRVDDVVECVLAHVALLEAASDEALRRLWYEGALIAAMRFRFSGCSKDEPIDRVSEVAGAMQAALPHITSPREIFSSQALRQKCDVALLRAFFAKLRPESMLLLIVAQKEEWPGRGGEGVASGADVDAAPPLPPVPLVEQREDYYQVLHAHGETNAETKERWSSVVGGGVSMWSDHLSLPPPNDFIPTVIEADDEEEEEEEEEEMGEGDAVGAEAGMGMAKAETGTAPVPPPPLWETAPVQLEVPRGTLWYKRDAIFGEPKVNVFVRILLPPCVWTSTSRRVYLDLLLALVSDELDSLSYMADLAGLFYKVGLGSGCVLLRVWGFTTHTHTLLAIVLNALIGFNSTTTTATAGGEEVEIQQQQQQQLESKWTRVRERVLRGYQSFANSDPSTHALYYAKLALHGAAHAPYGDVSVADAGRVSAKLAAIALEEEGMDVSDDAPEALRSAITLEGLVQFHAFLFKQGPLFPPAASQLSAAELGGIPLSSDAAPSVKAGGRIDFEVLVHGAASRVRARGLCAQIESALFSMQPPGVASLARSLRPEWRSIALPPLSHVTLRATETNAEQTCGATLMRLQCGVATAPKVRVLAELVAHILTERIYDQLRTKEQLGYVVWLWSIDVDLRNSSELLLLVTSDKATPSFVEARMEAFLVDARELLEEAGDDEDEDEEHASAGSMSASDDDGDGDDDDEEEGEKDEDARMSFAEYKSSLIALKRRKPLSMYEESASHFGEICSGNHHFARSSTSATAINALTLDDVLAWWDRYVAVDGSERRKFVAAVAPGSDSNITLRTTSGAGSAASSAAAGAATELTLETLSAWRTTQPLLAAAHRGRVV